jgi:uridylate kinase
VASDSGDEPLTSPSKWRRVVLKLSGEALAEEGGFGLAPIILDQVASSVVEARLEFDVDLAIVVGGGNFWRGLQGSGQGMDQAQADYMGMIATVMNGLALQDALERMGQPTRVMTALEMPKVAEPYIRRRAIRHLEKGRVVIFAGGTGNPFFTTDTAAALRACEIGAETILMGKNGVEGLLDADPRVHAGAKLITEISHREAIERGLKVMDTTALSLCMENDMPIRVFNVNDERNIVRVTCGETIGTLVRTRSAVAAGAPREPAT